MNPKILVIISTILIALGQIFWKIASETFSFNPIQIITNIPLILGAILYAAGAILLIKSLKTLDLSTTHPILAISFLWITILAFFLLNEPITLTKMIGIISIIIGAVVLAKKC